MPQGGNGGGPAKGVNKILGSPHGDDILIGTDDVDAIFGRGGNDVLDGLGGDDTLDGGDGNDQLSDFLGDNTLDGGAGDDTLSVNGSNNDVLTGGAGADVFRLLASEPIPAGTIATTTITDFEPGVDTIVFPTFFDVLGTAQQVGADVHIVFAEGLTLVLQDTLLGDLSETDFVLPEPTTIVGTAGDDSLEGTLGPDVMLGLGGNDTLVGLGGNDQLSDFIGDNTLDGGTGDDTLSVNGSNNDVLTGGAGADVFSLIPEAPIFPGTVATTTITDFEPGTDTVIFPVFVDVLGVAQQVGSDVHIPFREGLTLVLQNTLVGDLQLSDFQFTNNGTIIGTAGDDSINGTPGADVIIGHFGNDFLSGGDGDDLLYGNQPDVLSTELETLLGGAGNDMLFGGVGGDSLDGGADNDILLIGTLGNHAVAGGTGADLFSVTEAIDVVPIGDLDPAPANLVNITDFEIGIDVIKIASDPLDLATAAVQQGTDTLIVYDFERGVLFLNTLASDLQIDDFAFEGPNAAQGSSRGDVLVGNAGANFMEGLGGDDVISALDGNDTVDGGLGNDTLFGGGGNDTLLGGDGDDLLIGRFGDDVMTGGTGADVFGIHIPNPTVPSLNSLDNYGTDTITDFELGIDTIRFGWTPFAVLPFATQVGADAHIDYATGSTLILQNTNLGDLSEASFVFDTTPVEDPGLL